MTGRYDGATLLGIGCSSLRPTLFSLMSVERDVMQSRGTRTMNAAYLWGLLLAGCCHERSVTRAADNVPAALPAGSEERCKSDCALSLKMGQLPQQSEIVLKFSIMNVSRERVMWVSSSPRVRNGPSASGESEIEFRLTDHNMREVLPHCTVGEWDHEPPVYVALPPGQSVKTTYTLIPGCYLLDPGEILSAIAIYSSVADRPDNPPESTVFHGSVDTGSWQQVVVPKEWNAGRK